MLWVFAFFWNVVSFPIAILVVRDVVTANGEWVALLVLLFPLIGVLVLWAAIASTVSLLRRGGGSLSLQTADPRVGAPLQGSVSFPRGVKAGDAFKVVLACTETASNQGGTTMKSFWKKEVTARASDVGGNTRVAFRFDIPAGMPASRDGGDVKYAWRVEIRPQGRVGALAQGFDIALQPATQSAIPPLAQLFTNR